MPTKTPGNPALPPDQSRFNLLPLNRLCLRAPEGIRLRLHSLDPKTGNPWNPIFFSQRGTGRFDHPSGPGVLYVGETLAGIMMEIFDDKWGAIGDSTRASTTRTLGEWFVSKIYLPELTLFDATGGNLSKIGSDSQVFTGQYSISQGLALRMATHPHMPDGILYRSRHDPSLVNYAVFSRDSKKSEMRVLETRKFSDSMALVVDACRQLEVSILP